MSIMKKISDCSKCQSLLVNNAKLVTKIQSLKSQLKTKQVESRTDKKKLNQTTNDLNRDDIVPFSEKILNSQQSDLNMRQAKRQANAHKSKPSKCVLDFTQGVINEQAELRISQSKEDSENIQPKLRLKQRQLKRVFEFV